MRGLHRAAAVAALGAALCLTACTPAPEPAPPPPPSASPAAEVRPPVIDRVSRVLVLGDSVTLGVNACPADDRICATASWATGGAGVESLAVRAAAQNPAVEVTALARDGARLSTAVGNLPHVLDADAQLVVLFLGANDACAPSIDAMTDPDEFAVELSTLLSALHDATDPYLLVVQVPNLEHVWEVGHDRAGALRAWASTPACRSLLGDADDTGHAADERRTMVSARVAAYNAAIVEVCGRFPRCASDGGRVHDHPFDADELSAIDYFHPSEAGQRVIASIIWEALAEVPTEGG